MSINQHKPIHISVSDFTPEILNKISTDKIVVIYIESEYNSVLPNLPPWIKAISFGKYSVRLNCNEFAECDSYFNDPVYSSFNKELGNLPKKLLHLHFPSNSDFNQQVDNLPSNLLSLSLGKSFNQPVNCLPSSLICLALGENFSQSIENIPVSIEYLIFKNFNPLNSNLPPNLKCLSPGENFNCERDCKNWPQSLTTLLLSNNFNSPIEQLPNHIEYLYLGNQFNQSIDKLPEKLKKLRMHTIRFDYSFDNLPTGLEELKFTCRNKHMCRFDNLPSKLNYLRIRTPSIFVLDCLPNQIKKLDLVYDFNDDIADDDNEDNDFNDNYYHLIDNLPNSIEELEVDVNTSLDNLPNSVKVLTLDFKSSQSFNQLPNSIEYLNLCGQEYFDFESLPKSIKKIVLDRCSNFSLTGIKNLINLEKLKIFHHKDSIIKGSLEYLQLDDFDNYDRNNSLNDIVLTPKLINLIPKCLIKIHVGYERDNNKFIIRIDNTK